MRDIEMIVSTPLLGLGIALTGVGFLMILQSLKLGEEHRKLNRNSYGVLSLGHIPLLFGSRGRWILVGIAIFILILFFITMASSQPTMIGW
jgi:uncharacterized membrane protein